MISVAEALEALFGLVAPLKTERVPLRAAVGRVLADPVVAARNQPPFRASIMDGYAIWGDDAKPRDSFKVIGEAAAGHRFDGELEPGTCVRIFTGAPVPDGAERVIIQEDVSRDGSTITLKVELDSSKYIRGIGADFKVEQTLEAPRRLTPSDIALIAAMNVAEVTVFRRPIVALIATGDELVNPGEAPTEDQIIASNGLGLAAMIESHGGIARLLPIARDTDASLNAVFDMVAGADLLITIGGASVGDHDLVGQVAAARGMERSFYKVAMRPGKPLMAGRLDGTPMVGLPGNPVSSMVCGQVFILPMLDVLQGLPPQARATEQHKLTEPLAANGPREHYMRAHLDENGVQAAPRQDSALLTVLASANALVVRPPFDPEKSAGDSVDVIRLTPGR